jgi:hypothetical protein
MKKLQLIIILLVIILLPVSSQKSIDALYLKNGSIIYGKLVEISENQYKMQTSDGSQFIYPLSDVEKYVKESPVFAGRKTEGFGFGLEAGFLVGAQNSNYDAPFSFNILGSYAVKTKYIVSLGSGVEFIGVPFSPVFLELKYLLKEKKTTPFFFARSGALIHLGGDDDGDNYNNNYDKKNFKGGFSAALGTGVSWAKEDIEPYLSFAYRYAATSYEQRNYNEEDATYKNSYNRLEIKFGFRF